MWRGLLSLWIRRWRTHSWTAAAVAMLRSLRLLVFPRSHRQLMRLACYRKLAMAVDPCHHLTHRHYLARHFPLPTRVHAALAHYQIQEQAFNQHYYSALCRQQGLCVWSSIRDGEVFSIRLMSPSLKVEGDLVLSLFAGEERIQRCHFSWQLVATHNQLAIAPLVGCLQGAGPGQRAAAQRFVLAFPHQSMAGLCYAALLGLAQTMRSPCVFGVSARSQLSYEPIDATHFQRAYDQFWDAMGGVDQGHGLYVLPPRPSQTPLHQLPAKHRKRAQLRRALLNEIMSEARYTLACCRAASAPDLSALAPTLDSTGAHVGWWPRHPEIRESPRMLLQ